MIIYKIALHVWYSSLLKNKKLAMKDDNEKYPEPPELRKAGVPPLLKVVKITVIAIVITFVIILAFSIIFKLKNG
jgi:hypothetical protein